MATITFYGAAGTVTGSKHLLEANGQRILLDCGAWQGQSDTLERNRNFPFSPESVDQVIISHAHLDHIGMLPLLVKRGFKGPIWTTPATRDVAQFMLADMASIEEQDAAYRQRHRLGAPDERLPLITPKDIPPLIKRIVEVPYWRDRPQWQEISPGINLKFLDAGHILGSAVTVLKFSQKNTDQALAYTGDLGPQGMPLLRDPEIIDDEINTLIMESTYGSRRHQSYKEALDRLATTINTICEHKGKIIVPAFSLGRTQQLVYLVHKLVDEGKIPRFPIYVDSPLATNITDIYQRHRNNYDQDTQVDFAGQDHAPLAFRNLTYIRTVEESKQLNDLKGPIMIIASSGMMTAGRVIHHLRHNIGNAHNAILITGYQAEGTLGRRLLEGAQQVELHGDKFTVKAAICLFNEFSAHADQGQLEAYAAATPGLKRVILVHGEPHQADDLKKYLTTSHPQWEVIRPAEGDLIELWP